MSDLISRQEAIGILDQYAATLNPDRDNTELGRVDRIRRFIQQLPPAQPERLTDCDFETIRIHLNAYKEKLCNQQRWKEAEEYQRIIDRFMAFASAQPERKKGEWQEREDYNGDPYYTCTSCGESWYTVSGNNPYDEGVNFCPNCGADMRGEEDGKIS